MRWLAVLAIVIVGAVVYLRFAMSDGATAPREPSKQPEVAEKDEPSQPAAGATNPLREARPSVTPKREAPAQARPLDKPDGAPDLPAAAAIEAPTEEVEWTEQQRWQQLWTANGRWEKGNYPGAVEASLELARRYPPWQEDAWKVAIQAYCALGESEKANALFKKMTDATAIAEITKTCTEWNVKLSK